MARTSRVHRKELPQETGNAKTAVGRVYRVALYVRLSVPDGGHKDSDTAETQELLLRKFIEGKPYFSLFGVYVDNGESGVSFERDQFERMMGDVRTGRVDCIIVKDLSRFGRNYIEAGEYLEKVFPFLGVRFIAVNDGIDTADPLASDILPLHLKNLVNDSYARDISKKVRSALRGKQERGEFVGALAAYGYRKSGEDKHRLVVDEKTAPVVRDIFAWRLAGLGYRDIARRLNQQGVPSPRQYGYEEGLSKNARFSSMPWGPGTIRNIVKNQVYLGHMVQNKYQRSLFQGKKQTVNREEDWIVVRDTHEAIVDQQTFDKVQQMHHVESNGCVAKQGHPPDSTENILKGLVRCGSCGRKLIRHRNVGGDRYKTPKLRVLYYYTCVIHANDPVRCGFRGIPEKEVLRVVSEAIRVQVQLAGQLESLALHFQGGSGMERERIKGLLEQAEAELGKVRRHRESLYDDYADHLMNEQDYIYARARYMEKEAALQNRISELDSAFQSLCSEKVQDNPWLKNMLRFRDSTELTGEMAAALVEEITVYHKGALHVRFRFQDDLQKLQETLGEGGRQYE